MTAELFVKLSAKIIAGQKNDGDCEASSPLSDQNKSPCTNLDSHDSHSDTDSLKPSSQTDDQVTPYPPCNENSYVNANPYSILGDIETEQQDIEVEKTDAHRWLPGFSDKFWMAYINKLRVNSIDSGICDLAQLNQNNEDNPIEMEL